MAVSLRTRLYVQSPLQLGTSVVLSLSQVHYLRNVLRLSAGVEVALFNGQDGEWIGEIGQLSKETGTANPKRQVRTQSCPPDLWLLFAPIKRAGIDLIAEKASELGATALWPTLTRHTDVARVNTERLQANAIEAAEQSERLCVPTIHEPQSLSDILSHWPEERVLMVCAETGPAEPIAKAIAGIDDGRPAAVLIGPEGGFAQSELELLASKPYVVPVKLGPRVLRAETAVFAALSCWQALKGDWV